MDEWQVILWKTEKKMFFINREAICKLQQIAQFILDRNLKVCSFVGKEEMLSKAHSG